MTFHPISRKIIVVFILLSAFVTVGVFAQSSVAKIEVGEGTVVENGSSTLPIYLSPSNAATALAVVTTEIAYDQASIEVIGCELVGFEGVCDTETAGLVKLSAVNVQGITQKTTIANIQLKATGSEGDIAEFSPTTSLLGDVSGTSIASFSDTAGKVTVNKDTANFTVFIPILVK